MADRPYPPAPWLLHGRAIVIPALVRAPVAAGGPRLRRGSGGGTLGGLLLASYGPSSTLSYNELLGVGGFVWAGVTPAAWITHAHVDDAASTAGGRSIWGIPKRDGDFEWVKAPAGERLSVSLAGRELITVSVATRPRAVSLPIAAPFVGADRARRAWVSGRLRGAPVSVRVRLPADSPLSELAPRFSRTGVAGAVALRVGVPRDVRRR